MHISNKIALDVSQIDKLLHIASQGCNGKTDGRDIFDNLCSVAGEIWEIDLWRYYSY